MAKNHIKKPIIIHIKNHIKKPIIIHIKNHIKKPIIIYIKKPHNYSYKLLNGPNNQDFKHIQDLIVFPASRLRVSVIKFLLIEKHSFEDTLVEGIDKILLSF